MEEPINVCKKGECVVKKETLEYLEKLLSDRVVETMGTDEQALNALADIRDELYRPKSKNQTKGAKHGERKDESIQENRFLLRRRLLYFN